MVLWFPRGYRTGVTIKGDNWRAAVDKCQT